MWSNSGLDAGHPLEPSCRHHDDSVIRSFAKAAALHFHCVVIDGVFDSATAGGVIFNAATGLDANAIQFSGTTSAPQ